MRGASTRWRCRTRFRRCRTSRCGMTGEATPRRKPPALRLATLGAHSPHPGYGASRLALPIRAPERREPCNPLRALRVDASEPAMAETATQPKTAEAATAVKQTARAVEQQSRKVADTAHELQKSSGRIETSAEITTRLAADRNILAA